MTIRTRLAAASLVLIVAAASPASAAVHIERMTSTVDSSDDGSLLTPGMLSAIIDLVLETISGQR